jgi:hypothetical protein
MTREEVLRYLYEIYKSHGHISKELIQKHPVLTYYQVKKYGGIKRLAEELKLNKQDSKRISTRNWRSPVRTPHKGKISDEELLQEFLRLYELFGKVTNQIIANHGRFGPTAYKDHFGSLLNVYRLLGLEPHKEASHRATPITREELVEDVLRVFREHGRITKELYLREGKYSRKPIERLFGSFNNMLRELGLPINCEINIPEEHLLEELRRLKDEYGYVSHKVIKEASRYSVETFMRRFGSLNNAYRAAGLEDRIPGNPVTARIIIEKIAKILNSTYILEKSFPWLVNPKTGRKLYVDAYFPAYKLCIEYNGEQHYIPQTERFGEDELEKFKVRKYRDYIKQKLISAHGLKLLVIRYDEPITEEWLRQRLAMALEGQVISA